MHIICRTVHLGTEVGFKSAVEYSGSLCFFLMKSKNKVVSISCLYGLQHNKRTLATIVLKTSTPSSRQRILETGRSE